MHTDQGQALDRREGDGAGPARRRGHYRVTFAVLCLSVFSFSFLQSMVTPVLPTIQSVFDTSQQRVTWVLTAYLLSASVFTPIVGRVGDKVGKKRMLVVALGALACGSLLAALAPSIAVLILARVVQGVGGGVLPLAFGIIRDEFPASRVAGAIGSTAALLAVGVGSGLVIAGPVVDALGFRWLFWLPMLMSLVAAGAAALLVPESRGRAPGRISAVASVLMSSWLVALLLALGQAHVWGFGSWKVVGLLATATVVLVCWVLVELRSADPLVDMRMMRLPTVLAVNVVSLLFGAGMYSLFAFLPQFVQTPSAAGYGFGASVTESGLILLPQTAVAFVTGLCAGPLTARFGSKWVLVAGAALTSVGTTGLAFLHQESSQVVVCAAVIGAGFGLAFGAMSNLIVLAVPQTQTGVATGMNTNIRTVGGAIGGAALGAVIGGHLRPDGVPVELGYQVSFFALAVASALAAALALVVPDLRAPSRSRAEPARPVASVPCEC